MPAFATAKGSVGPLEALLLADVATNARLTCMTLAKLPPHAQAVLLDDAAERAVAVTAVGGTTDGFFFLFFACFMCVYYSIMLVVV